MQEKLLYTIKETMQATALGRTSVYKAINKGKLIAKKFGSKTLITVDSIETFIATLPEMGDSND